MRNFTHIFSSLLILIFSTNYSFSQKDMSKSLRINDYISFIGDADTTSGGMGLSNTVELSNYKILDAFSLSYIKTDKIGNFSTQNTFSFFLKNNLALKNTFGYSHIRADIHEVHQFTDTLFYNPMQQTWSFNSPPPPPPGAPPIPTKDTVITNTHDTTVSQNYLMVGFTLQTYNHLINPGLAFYYSKIKFNQDMNNLQLSFLLEVFKERKINGFIHLDYIKNSRNDTAQNGGTLYFIEGQLSAKVRPFIFTVNAGYGESMFRYNFFDYGHLENTPMHLQAVFGGKIEVAILPRLNLFGYLSDNIYYGPPQSRNTTTNYISFYAGAKISLKKY